VNRRPRLPSDQELRKAYPDLWAWYDAHYPKATRPRRSLLALALVRRLSCLQLLSKALPNRLKPVLESEDPSDTAFDVATTIKALYVPQRDVQRFLQLDSEANELLTYLNHPSPPRSDEQIAEELESRGLTATEIVRLIPHLRNRRVGHPVTNRVEAVNAAEMFDRGLSWTQIANRLPPPPNGVDIFRQRERVRKAVKSLDKVFHKFGIPIPPRRARA